MRGNSMGKTIPMVRDEDGKTADVHLDEVANMRAAGFVERAEVAGRDETASKVVRSSYVAPEAEKPRRGRPKRG